MKTYEIWCNRTGKVVETITGPWSSVQARMTELNRQGRGVSARKAGTTATPSVDKPAAYAPIPQSESGLYYATSDGSNDKDVLVGWGLIIRKDAPNTGQEVHRNNGQVTDEAAKKHWNVAGELAGAIRAVLWAKRNNARVVIRADFQGVRDYYTGAWKRKNPETRGYHEWMHRHERYIADIQWVPGHNGDRDNEIADMLAREAIGKGAR